MNRADGPIEIYAFAWPIPELGAACTDFLLEVRESGKLFLVPDIQSDSDIPAPRPVGGRDVLKRYSAALHPTHLCLWWAYMTDERQAQLMRMVECVTGAPAPEAASAEPEPDPAATVDALLADLSPKGISEPKGMDVLKRGLSRERWNESDRQKAEVARRLHDWQSRKPRQCITCEEWYKPGGGGHGGVNTRRCRACIDASRQKPKGGAA